MTQLERKALETLYYVLRNFVIWADRVPNSRKDRRAYRLRAIDRWVGKKLDRPMVFISPKEDVKWGYVARPRPKKNAKRPVRPVHHRPPRTQFQLDTRLPPRWCRAKP